MIRDKNPVEAAWARGRPLFEPGRTVLPDEAEETVEFCRRGRGDGGSLSPMLIIGDVASPVRDAFACCEVHPATAQPVEVFEDRKQRGGTEQLMTTTPRWTIQLRKLNSGRDCLFWPNRLGKGDSSFNPFLTSPLHLSPLSHLVCQRVVTVRPMLGQHSMA